MKRYHIIVHGRVQGVGFRYHTQQHAVRHGIKGWVRNNPDGTVEIDAEGENHDMDRFIRELRKGSMNAKVTDVEYEENPHTGTHHSFQIQY
ncbi:MAG TPA: acylphosphatase [Bacillales bacterium]|nr:acylphosphatase [Bacillales bacterium]